MRVVVFFFTRHTLHVFPPIGSAKYKDNVTIVLGILLVII